MISHHAVLAITLVAAAACGDPPAPVGPAGPPAPRALTQGAPTPVDPEPFLDAVASAVCGFPVQIAQTGKGKAIELPGGRILYTSPGLTATLTNLTTGSAEKLVITGAFHTTALPNGDTEYVVTGRNLLGFDAASGGPFLVLSQGRFTFTIDPAGTLVEPLEGDGKLTNVCPLLS